MFCGDRRRVSRSKKPATLQSKVAGKIGELFVYDVVVSDFFLISVDVFDVNSHSNHFGCKKDKAVDQAFCCLLAYICLVAFYVFLDIFVAQALHLLLG